MKLAVVGTGYVGLVQAVCLADLGNRVWGIDIDPEKSRLLAAGTCPIFEPGLEELLRRNLREGRVSFSSDYTEALQEAEVVFLAVGTPSLDDGRADLSAIKTAAQAIGDALQKHLRKELVIVVNKSTVPVGTGDYVLQLIKERYVGEVAVVSNPEFLREGSAVNDFLRPDRIVIGTDSQLEAVRHTLEHVYAPLQTTVFHTDLKTAELIKYASNAFLATQISFINSIAGIAEAVNADVTQVARGMRLDQRIGSRAFLDAGVGYGGSCFPKDVRALLKAAEDAGVSFPILEATESVNAQQRVRIINKVTTLLPKLNGARIAIWGLSFKAKTDDIREAPAIEIIHRLQEAGAQIVVFDPVAHNSARSVLMNVNYADTALAAVDQADALLILTDWDEFRQTDLKQLKERLARPNIIDGRNLFHTKDMSELSFNYLSIGRPDILMAPVLAEAIAQ